MDDPNMTMEECIKLEEEKAHRRGRVFNWQTATYGKIRIDDDLYDLSSVEAKFLAKVINDAFAPEDALYEGLEYSDADIADFEARLARIYRRETAGFGAYWADSARQIPDKGDLMDYWIGISSAGDFLGTSPSYTMIQDPILRLCHRLIASSIAGRSQTPDKVTPTDLFYLRGMDIDSINVPYFLARYLRLFDAVRKSGAHISVIAPELLIIDMAELVRLHICAHFDDTWAWVAKRPERQPDAAAGAPAVAEDAPAVDEGDHAVLALVQAPQQPPPPPPPPAARTVPQRLGRLEKDVQGLYRDVGSLCGLVERSMSDQGRFSTWMMTCMTQLMDASGLAYQAFDRTF
ncbi:hypothetical protein Tco_1309384 [Tanacetum coccineum]